MADGALRLWVARGGRELLGLWVAAGSRPGTPGWRTERCGCGLPGMAASSWGCGLLLGPGRVRRDGGRSAAVTGCQGWQRAPGVVGCCWVGCPLRLRVASGGCCWVPAGGRRDGGRSAAVAGCQGQRAPGVVGCCWEAGYAGMADGALRLLGQRACGLLLGPGRGRRDGGRSAAVVGCQGWQRAPGVVGCCWVPAGDAGMADGALRLWVARGGSELLGLWVAAGSRPGTPGWRTERCGCGLPGMAASSWGCGLLLGPGRVRRDGGRGRSAAVVGCQGWQRAPGVVGCCWVPAADAGMAEG